MKVVLSRKGFDSSLGGCPSPIFPDGLMHSLPIPYAGSKKRYSDVSWSRGNLGELLTKLSRSGANAEMEVHLDPDLDRDSLPRRDGWLPAFGQAGAFQSHLVNQGVGVGDVFLFYGWFAHVASDTCGHWVPVPGARDMHVIFGWLQVGSVLDVEALGAGRIIAEYPWLADHPHLHIPDGEAWGRNVIYVARSSLDLRGGAAHGIAGGGVIRKYSDCLALTHPLSPNRSRWRLPSWFLDADGSIGLSCNPNRDKCQRDGEYLSLRSVRPQEQVIDCADRPEAAHWLLAMLGN